MTFASYTKMLYVVADKRLGKVITEELGLECLHGKKYDEIIRGIRSQLSTLVSGNKSHGEDLC